MTNLAVLQVQEGIINSKVITFRRRNNWVTVILISAVPIVLTKKLLTTIQVTVNLNETWYKKDILDPAGAKVNDE